MPKNLSYHLLRLALSTCCLGACVDDAAATSGGGGSVAEKATGIATATIEYTLPADGCAFVVHIDQALYAPDEATLEALRPRVTGNGTITLQVKYALTGRTGRVECGFNTHRDLPEVALVLQDR